MLAVQDCRNIKNTLDIPHGSYPDATRRRMIAVRASAAAMVAASFGNSGVVELVLHVDAPAVAELLREAGFTVHENGKWIEISGW
jgi:hypothetical protein